MKNEKKVKLVDLKVSSFFVMLDEQAQRVVLGGDSTDPGPLDGTGTTCSPIWC